MHGSQSVRESIIRRQKLHKVTDYRLEALYKKFNYMLVKRGAPSETSGSLIDVMSTDAQIN